MGPDRPGSQRPGWRWQSTLCCLCLCSPAFTFLSIQKACKCFSEKDTESLSSGAQVEDALLSFFQLYRILSVCSDADVLRCQATCVLDAAVPIYHSCSCNLIFAILINYPAEKRAFSSASPLAPENEDSEKNHENTFILLNYAKQ